MPNTSRRFTLAELAIGLVVLGLLLSVVLKGKDCIEYARFLINTTHSEGSGTSHHQSPTPPPATRTMS